MNWIKKPLSDYRIRTPHLGFPWTTKLLIRNSHAIKLMANLTKRNELVLGNEPSLNAHILIFLFLFSVWICFVLFCFFFLLIFQADTSLILFHLIVENLILHIFLIIMIIIPCSGMFPNVRIFARRPATNRKILFHSSHGIPGISNRNIWSNGKLPLCFVSRAEQLCPEMNAYGTTFHGGKSIEKYMRWLIIDDILSGGGNVWTA